MRRPLLVLLLTLGLSTLLLTGAQAADEVSGLQLAADNAATASAAASSAPLVSTTVSGLAGPAVGQTLAAPRGFTITQIVSGLRGPRFMTFDELGNLLVADAAAGAVYRYPFVDGAPVVATEAPPPLVSGLDAPSNVALHDGYLYIGETRTIARYRYNPAGDLGAREAIVGDLPRGGHSTRTVQFGPDGLMYVAVGSSCNICDESDERRAAILRYTPDGKGYERFAWGTRNPVGLAFQPGTGLLWTTVNERDNQGNEIPPDLVTIVRQGQNFGWPGCQPPDATPQDSSRVCTDITAPTIGIQAHSAPLGLAFATGDQFPADYADDLFVVQHGSWNRQPPAEPKLLRIHFEGAQPVSARDFLSGWQNPQGQRWGRPAGVVVAPDGSLIVSDDQAGVLYRVVYSG